MNESRAQDGSRGMGAAFVLGALLATRLGINLTYAVSWLRQEENQYLSVPAEVARTLPEPLLRLMGYARGAYALGYVDDLRDPLEVLLGRPTGRA